MADLRAHREDWEQLAELDPMWAVVSSPEHRFGRWDADAFFATGEVEVARVLDRARSLGLAPPQRRALDFGCGVGRVTRSLRSRFDEVVGVDIAQAMVEQARARHAGWTGLEFVHNDAADLAVLGDGRFDLVYTRLVLQHVPGRDIARSYVQEFVRLLTPEGLAMFQIPVHLPLRYRGLATRRLWSALRRLGVPPATLYQRFKLHPIRMQHAEQETVRRWVQQAGGRVVAVDLKRGVTGVQHGEFFVVRRPSDGDA